MRRSNLLAPLVAVAALTLTAANAGAQTPCPPAPGEATPIVHVQAPAARLTLRVANTPATREYGLMCVRALEPHAGMVFVFAGGDALRDFWMKNTLIPLDMVFVARNGRVTAVAANVPATTTDTPDEQIPHRDGTGSYVIELAAGAAAASGIVPGATIRVPRGL